MDTKALFKLGYGLYVLTAKDGQQDNGCIVNTVMQITSTPLQLIIGVNKQNYTHDMIMKTGLCNISALTTETPFSVFEHFGFQSGKTVNKFADYQDTKRSTNGLLYLSQYANAYISGKVVNTVDYGSHTLFTVEVTDAEVFSAVDSLTYAYYQSHTKPKPQQAAKATGYRCTICGYIYEGEPLPEDFICPLCKHGAADFEKI